MAFLEIFSNFDVQALHLDFLNIVKWTCKEAQACMPVTISLETNYIVERMKQGHTGTILYVNWNAIESQIYIWYTLIAELYVYHSVIRTTSSRRFLHNADLRTGFSLHLRLFGLQAATKIRSFNLMAHDFQKNAPLHFPCSLPSFP